MKRVLFAICLAVPAFAQSTPQQPTINETVVVTASSLPETVQTTPASVTVIARKDIDERAANDIADVLREVPGLVLARSGSPGKATSLFTRGAASTQTLVMWNGIVLNNPYFSGYDWGRFSTAGVEQIEVVRGPFSALYGSEAMAGVVNVLTTPRTSGIHGDVESGSHGLRNAMLDAAIANRLRHEYFGIGPLTAERLKIERGYAGRPPGSAPYVVAGTDMQNLRPGKRAVDEILVAEAMRDGIDRIARAAWAILEATPPDLAGELMEAGIVLTGGGALIPGLAGEIAARTNVPTTVADDPLGCVARGAGEILASPDVLERLRPHADRLTRWYQSLRIGMRESYSR